MLQAPDAPALKGQCVRWAMSYSQYTLLDSRSVGLPPEEGADFEEHSPLPRATGNSKWFAPALTPSRQCKGSHRRPRTGRLERPRTGQTWQHVGQDEWSEASRFITQAIADRSKAPESAANCPNRRALDGPIGTRLSCIRDRRLCCPYSRRQLRSRGENGRTTSTAKCSHFARYRVRSQ